MEVVAAVRSEAIPVPLRDLMNQQTIDAALLPWLAWALNTLEFRSDASEADQRAAITASVGVHDILGTPAALKKGLELIGFIDVTIVEPLVVLDGSFTLDGSNDLTGAYMFDLKIGSVTQITPQQVAEIRRIIEVFSNRRSHLRKLFIAELVLDGTWLLDGSKQLDGGFILG